MVKYIYYLLRLIVLLIYMCLLTLETLVFGAFVFCIVGFQAAWESMGNYFEENIDEET